MSDPSVAVQKAIYDRLTSALGSGIKVVDNIEQAGFIDSLPFILIGDDVITDESTDCVQGYEVRTFIRCHHKGPSRKATKELAHSVRTAMRADFTIPGFSDPITYHVGTRHQLFEGVAHVAIIEWHFGIFAT